MNDYTGASTQVDFWLTAELTPKGMSSETFSLVLDGSDAIAEVCLSPPGGRAAYSALPPDHGMCIAHQL